MATVQKLPLSTLSTTSSYASCKTDGMPEQFPAGLRVLVVDDDTTCLKILERMLRRCLYHVTTCCQAKEALSLLREMKGGFDVVISDVHMPDMDGFKLLELVGLEMDLPVIMMSADGRTSAVMKGIEHGACDYLIKPVRIEELKNIWQHVIRKKRNESKELEQSGSVEDSDRHRKVCEDADYGSSVSEVTDGNWKFPKKRRDAKEEDDDGEQENDDPSASKKPRVVWSVELHQQFVSAVNQLGIDKAVPKRILELMNVPGLTRENVASHLQKFRLYLKRLSGVAQHQGGIPTSFCGSVETSPKLGSLGRLDIQALSASGQLPPQTLAALHAELLGHPAGSLPMPTIEQPFLLQASLQGSKCIPVESGVAFGQPLVKCQSNVSKQLPQRNLSPDSIPAGFPMWSPHHLGEVAPTGNIVGLTTRNNNMLVQILQQQQQQPQQTVIPEPSHALNVQPSCLIAPTGSATCFPVGNNPVSFNQTSRFSNSTVTDYSQLTSQCNESAPGFGQISDGDFKNEGLLCGYSTLGSVSSSISSCSVRSESSTGWRVQNSGINIDPTSRLPGQVPNACETQASYTAKTGSSQDQRPGRNLGFVGKGSCIPSRFAIDDAESPTGDLIQGKACLGNGDKVKQEFNLDFMESAKGGIPVLPHFSPNDLMSILSK